jgi:medium-chain acyl-[acyl-carrier-protein] hydrolase
MSAPRPGAAAHTTTATASPAYPTAATQPVQLFCLPYAGGTAAMFHRWTPAVPPGVTVVPIELPGHGLRREEPPVTAMHVLARRLADEIRAQLTSPYALFGHSLGALLAFETARLLRRYAGEPAALFVSGRNAPSCRMPMRISQLMDEQLVAAAKAWGGLPPELASFPALQTRQLRLLRADLRLAEAYQRAPDEPLRCPLTVFSGRVDPLVDRAGLAAWRAETTATTELVMVPGGHLFVHDPAFAPVLATRLAQLTRPRRGAGQ